MESDSFGHTCGFSIYTCHDDGDWLTIKKQFLVPIVDWLVGLVVKQVLADEISRFLAAYYEICRTDMQYTAERRCIPSNEQVVEL